MSDPRLLVKNLRKSYAGPVLSDVDLAIDRGEVHALVGENGAGKTTLVNILAGLVQKDGGSVRLDGRPFDPASPAEAFAAGVSFAAQELSTIDNLTIAENVSLRNLPRHRGVVDRERLRGSARRALVTVGLGDADPDARAGELSLSDRQLLEIARALQEDAGLLMLDEPTAALTASEAKRLHGLIREHAARGVSVLYISHRLADVLELADTVSVLRDGRMTLTAPAKSLSVDDLLAAMAGRVFDRDTAGQERTRGEAMLRVESLTTCDLPGPVTITGHAGEIIGLAGLAGAGRSELLQAMFGLVPAASGSVLRIDGSAETVIRHPRQAVRLGVAMLGEDRQTMGIFPGLPLATNVMIPGRGTGVFRRIDRAAEAAATGELAQKLGIRCRGPEQDISTLSGGNQQKSLLARWLYCESDVFLLDEPTRGVDVGTKAAIYELLRELAGKGKCIFLASGELEELLAVCDRIVVLSGRRVAGEFDAGKCSEAELLAAAFSAHTDPTRAGAHPA